MNPESSDSPPQRLDLAAVVERMEAELRCLLGPTIRFQTGTLRAGGAPVIDARSEDLVDLLRHLALDARDAMHDGGTLTIRTGRLREVAECAAIVLHEVPDPPPAGGGVTGTHIRKGRSLGLSASYDTVERAGGHFHVSCRGSETVLTICFPLAQ